MSDDTTARPSSRRRGCVLAGSLALMIATAFVTVPLAGLSVMFTANCTEADDRIICSPIGEALLLGGPVGGLIVALFLSVVGAVMAHRRQHRLSLWLLAGWAVYAVGFSMDFVLTAQEQSPESEEHESAMIAAEEARRRAEDIAEYRARPPLEEAGPRIATLQSEVDAILTPVLKNPLQWTPPEDNGNCNMFGAPGANLFTEATVGVAQQRHWPAVIDTIAHIAGNHRMTPEPPGSLRTGERLYTATDDTSLSVSSEKGYLVITLFCDCRLSAAEKARLPR